MALHGITWYRAALRGMVQHFMAWSNIAWHEQHCMAQHGIAWNAAALRSMVQHSIVWSSMAWHGATLYSTAQHCMACSSIVWHGAALHGTGQHCIAQGSTAWHSTAQHSTATPLHGRAQHSPRSTALPCMGTRSTAHAAQPTQPCTHSLNYQQALQGEAATRRRGPGRKLQAVKSSC